MTAIDAVAAGIAHQRIGDTRLVGGRHTTSHAYLGLHQVEDVKSGSGPCHDLSPHLILYHHVETEVVDIACSGLVVDELQLSRQLT